MTRVLLTIHWEGSVEAASLMVSWLLFPPPPLTPNSGGSACGCWDSGPTVNESSRVPALTCRAVMLLYNTVEEAGGWPPPTSVRVTAAPLIVQVEAFACCWSYRNRRLVPAPPS